MFTVEYYESPDGDVPFLEWLDEFTDGPTVLRILVRIRRAGRGNFGDHKPVGSGVWELRLNFGPGYRVYYVKSGARILCFLGGGDKSSQRRDVARAIGQFTEFRKRGE